VRQPPARRQRRPTPTHVRCTLPPSLLLSTLRGVPPKAHPTRQPPNRNYTARPIICPTNHLPNQSFAQPIICPTNHLPNQSFARPIICPTNHLPDQSFARPIICPTNHLPDQSFARPTDHLTNSYMDFEFESGHSNAAAPAHPRPAGQMRPSVKKSSPKLGRLPLPLCGTAKMPVRVGRTPPRTPRTRRRRYESSASSPCALP
jgi:hypothetical protein